MILRADEESADWTTESKESLSNGMVSPSGLFLAMSEETSLTRILLVTDEMFWGPTEVRKSIATNDAGTIHICLERLIVNQIHTA